MTADDCFDQAMQFFDIAEKFKASRDPKIRAKGLEAEKAARELREKFLQITNQQPTPNQ